MPVFTPKVPDNVLITGDAPAPEAPDYRYASEFQKGLFRGGQKTAAAFADFGSLLANQVNAQELAQSLTERANQSLRRAQAAPARVPSLKDAAAVSDYVDFAIGGLGETVPTVATAIAGRGLGSKLGGGSAVAREAGTFGAVAVPETGITYGEIQREIGQERPGLALAAGVAKGALDVFSLGRALRPFEKGLPGVRGGLRREISGAVVREGATEGTQELIDIGALRQAKGETVFAPLAPDEFQRALDAAAIGAVAGGVMTGGAAAARAGLDKLQDPGEQTAPFANDPLKYLEYLRTSAKPEEVNAMASEMGYSDPQQMLDELESYFVGRTILDNPNAELYFYDQTSQMPWPSVELWEEAGVKAYSGSDKALETLLQRNPDIAAKVEEMRLQGKGEEAIQRYLETNSPYRKVTYAEIVDRQAEQQGKSVSVVAEEVARKVVERFPKLAPVLKKKGTMEFLKGLEVIEKDPIASVLENVDELSLTNQELFGRGSTAADRFSSAILRKPGRSNTPREGEILIRLKDAEGKWRTYSVNMMRLANTMMNKIGATQGALDDRVATAVMAGLSSIASLPNVKDVDFSFLDNLTERQKADLGVYYQKREGGLPPKRITLLDIEKKGPARAKAKAVSATARLLSAKSKLAELERQGKKLRSIVEKMVVESDVEKLNKLRQQYIRLRKQLPTLEADIEAAERELVRAQEQYRQEQEQAAKKEAYAEEMAYRDAPDEVGTGVESGDIAAVDKVLIDRGYSRADVPSPENLFNFDIMEDRFEKMRAEGDMQGAYDAAMRAYQSLNDLYTMLLVMPDPKYRKYWNQAYTKMTGRFKSNLTWKEVLKEVRNEQAIIANKIAETQSEKRRELLDAVRKMHEMKASPYGDYNAMVREVAKRSDEEWLNSVEYKVIRQQLNTLLDRVGIPREKVKLLAPSEATVSPFSRMPFGLAVMYKDGGYAIFVAPTMTPQAMANALAHEVGHLVEYEFFRTASSEDMAAIREEYEYFLSQTETPKQEFEFFDTLFKDRKVLLDVIQARMELDTDWATYRYIRKFEEWFADRAAARLVDPTPPKTKFQRAIEKLVVKLSLLFNLSFDQLYTSSVTEFVDNVMRQSPRYRMKGPEPVDVLLNFWRSNSPVEVIRPVKDDFNKSEIRKILSKYYKRVLGEELTDARLEQLMDMAVAMRRNPLSAAAHESFIRGVRTLLSEKERNLIIRATNSPYVRRQVMRYLAGIPESQQVARTNPEAMMGYAFQLWMAGEVSLSRRTATTMDKIVGLLRTLFGLVDEAKNAELIMKSFASGEAYLKAHEQLTDADARYVLQTPTKDTLIQRAVHDVLAPAWESTMESSIWRALFSAAGTRMRSTENPYLIEIANRVDGKYGEYVDEDMFSARTRLIGRFTNRIYNIFDTDKRQTEEFGQAVAEVLNTNRPHSDPEVNYAASQVKRVLDEIYQELTDAGVRIGYIENYFPWVFDSNKLTWNKDEFIALLNEPNIRQAMPEGLTPEGIYRALISNDGYADVEISDSPVTLTPGMRAINERTLRFIDEVATPEQRARFGEFMDDNIGRTLTTYIAQAAKRAEFQRRFGDGRLERMLMKAKEYGASDEQIQMANDFMDAAMGIAGYKTNQRLYRLFGKEAPEGEVINPRAQKVMGAVMVYQNLRLLSLATITSLVDPIGIAVRTGEVGIAFQAFKAGMKEVYKEAAGDPTVLTDIAEALGVIDRHMTLDALNWEYGGVFITGKLRRINEGFFKAIGLQGWTRATRIMGTDAAMRFIRRHVNNPNENSERYLAELNLTPDDVKFDKEGSVLILPKTFRQELRNRALDGDEEAQRELDRDNRVRAAIHKFTDTAILRPNAALRPIWASDPHFMLVFHLKSFTWAFHERITKRVVSEAANGNLAPLLAYAMFIPAMMASEMLRDLIQHMGDEDPNKVNWDTMDHVTYAIERSGVLGLGTLAVDATMDIKYGGIGVESFAGPTLEQINEIVIRQNPKWEDYVPLDAASIYAPVATGIAELGVM